MKGVLLKVENEAAFHVRLGAFDDSKLFRHSTFVSQGPVL